MLTEAQECFDSCWVLTGRDVQGLETDGDCVVCESWPDHVLLAERKVESAGMWWIWALGLGKETGR